MVLHQLLLLFLFSQEGARVGPFNVRQARVQRCIVVFNYYLLTAFEFGRQDYIS